MEQPNNQFTQQNNQFSQPVQGGQQFQGQQAFQGQQPMMVKTPKKPKKLGWIISLVAVALGILGLAIGGVMSLSNNPKTIVENIEKEMDRNPSELFVNPQKGLPITKTEKSVKYRVTKGNAFLIVFLSDKSGDSPKITVDGKEVTPFYSEKDVQFVGTDVKVKNYYYVVATSDEMLIKQVGQEETTGFPYLIGKPEIIEKVTPIMTANFIVLSALVFSGIALIIFIIFLVIFLVKNSTYKKLQVPSNFQY